MSVRTHDGLILLEGRSSAEDAETLLLALQEHPGATVDVAGVRKLHMAVLQILLALRPPVQGTPTAPFLSRNIFGPLISNSDSPVDFS